MSLQLRRGTDAERLTIVFSEGELIYTTDTKEVWVGDGITLGGIPIEGEAGGLVALIDDPAPQLGGDLDTNSYGINGIKYPTADGSATQILETDGLGNLTFVDKPTAPVDSVAGKTGVVSLDKTDVGLNNVDNTSDAAKPISSATQTALDGKVDDSEKGTADGVATLDATSKIPLAQIPDGVGGGIGSVSEDLAPQLGGDLTIQNNKLKGTDGSYDSYLKFNAYGELIYSNDLSGSDYTNFIFANNSGSFGIGTGLFWKDDETSGTTRATITYNKTSGAFDVKSDATGQILSFTTNDTRLTAKDLTIVLSEADGNFTIDGSTGSDVVFNNIDTINMNTVSNITLPDINQSILRIDDKDGSQTSLAIGDTSLATQAFLTTNHSDGRFSIQTPGDIDIDTNGSIEIHGITYPRIDGTTGQLLSTDGAGQLLFVDPPSGGGADVGTVYKYNTSPAASIAPNVIETGKEFGDYVAANDTHLFVSGGHDSREIQIFDKAGNYVDNISVSYNVSRIKFYKNEILISFSGDYGRIKRYSATDFSPLAPDIVSPEGESDTGEYFGEDMDVWGDYLVVGAKGYTTLVDGRVWLFDLTNQQDIDIIECPPHLQGHGKHFGQSVAIYDDKIVVGGNNAETFVYLMSDIYAHDWIFPQSSGKTSSVDINDKYIAVGEPSITDSGIADSGRVHIYDRTDYSLVHTIDKNTGAPTEKQYYMGELVKFEGDTLLVSMVSDTVNNGSVLIYNTNDWSLTQHLKNPDPTKPTYGVSFDADSQGNLFVGAGAGNQVFLHKPAPAITSVSDDPAPQLGGDLDTNGHGINGLNYPETDGTSGQLLSTDGSGQLSFVDPPSGGASVTSAPAKLFGNILAQPSTYTSDDDFGQSSAITDTFYVVGASKINRVYVYDVNTSELLQTLTHPNPYGSTYGDYFGKRLAASEKYIIVSSEEDYNNVDRSGMIFVYDATDFSLLASIGNPETTDTASDLFGSSIALYGDECVVGASGRGGGGSAYHIDLLTNNVIRTYYNPNAMSDPDFDYFGTSVEISEKYIGIAATNEKMLGDTNYTGVVYIFDKATGDLVYTIPPPKPINGGKFGLGLRIKDDILFASHPGEKGTDNKSYVGALYVYDLTNGDLIHTINNPELEDPEKDVSYDYFGETIDYNDDFLFVGSQSVSNDLGYLAIYSLEDYSLYTKIEDPKMPGVLGPDPTVGSDHFTTSLCANSNNVVIAGTTKNGVYVIREGEYMTSLKDDPEPTLSGPLLLNGNTINGISYPDAISKTPNEKEVLMFQNGAVYLTPFIDEEKKWYKVGEIKNPKGNSTSITSDSFGGTSSLYQKDGLKVFGNYIINSANRTKGPGGESNSGVVEVFYKDTLAHAYTIENPIPQQNTYFGGMVCADESFIFVGASGYNTYSGRIYIFNIVDGSFVQSIDNPNITDTPGGDDFGLSFDLTNDYLVVGAEGEKAGTYSNSGHVYVFNKTDYSLAYSIANPNTGYSYGEYFGHEVKANEKYIAVGAFESNKFGSDAGAVYVFDITTGEYLYDIGPEVIQIYGHFGRKVFINGDHLIVSATNITIDNVANSGTVQVHNIDTGELLYTLIEPATYNRKAGCEFGKHIASDGSILAIYSDAAGNDKNECGVVYFYNLYSGKLLYSMFGKESSDYFGNRMFIEDDLIYINDLGKEDSSTLGLISIYKNSEQYMTSNLITGSKRINGLKYPTSDGRPGQLLETDGFGNLIFVDRPSATELEAFERRSTTDTEPQIFNGGRTRHFVIDIDSTDMIKPQVEDFIEGVKYIFQFNKNISDNISIDWGELPPIKWQDGTDLSNPRGFSQGETFFVGAVLIDGICYVGASATYG